MYLEALPQAGGLADKAERLRRLDEKKDAKYIDLVQLADPFEYNPGMKGGALVEARFGKGRWIYIGLGLWRQLPYGTVGAYQLMANLISLGKVAPAGTR